MGRECIRPEAQAMDFYFPESFSFLLSLKAVIPLFAFFHSSSLLFPTPTDMNWHFATFMNFFAARKL
jgi:hypothetical protein